MDRVPRVGSVLTRYLVPGLLVVVALNQLRLAHVHDLTPWKGGGFGMFASVDRLDHRVVRAYLLTEDGQEIGIDVRDVPALRRSLHIARSVPMEQRLGRVAQRLANRDWVVEPASPSRTSHIDTTSAESADDPAPDAEAIRDGGSGGVALVRARPSRGVSTGAEQAVGVAAVRVEVWRIEFDSQSSTASMRKLAETVRRPS